MHRLIGIKRMLVILGLAVLPLLASAAAAVATAPIVAEPYEPDDQRIALIQQINDQYGLTLADRTAEWTLGEVMSVKAALDEIADRLAEIAYRDVPHILKGLLENTALYRDRAYNGNIAYAVGGTVSVYDKWAEYDETGRAFYLAHELGHVLDVHGSPLQLILGEVSSVFAHNVGAYVDADGVYHLGRYFPLQRTPDRIRHRSDSSAEDWAESFATVVVPEFEARWRNIGALRNSEVRRIIGLWIKQAGAEIRPLSHQ
jgi:hypothetical protein